MSGRPRVALAVLAGVLTACGGGGSSGNPAPTPSVQVTETYTGTTRQLAPGSCTGDSHSVIAADGAMSVRLVQTSDAAGALSVQVCSGGIDDGNCSIRQQKIAVGQSIGGTRIGLSSQNLKLLPHNCVFGGPVTADPVTYRAELTYMK